MPINLKVGKDLMSEGHYVCGQNNFSEPVRGVMNEQVASSGVTSFKSKIVEEFTSSNKCFKGHIASIVYPEWQDNVVQTPKYVLGKSMRPCTAV